MVTKEQIISARLDSEGFDEDELEELNISLRDLEINVSVMCEADPDGVTIYFKKEEL